MKYGQRGHGKPFLNSLDEIKEQVQELEHDSYHQETDSYVRFQERDELSDYSNLVEKPVVEMKIAREEYSEVMIGVEYPETKYIFSSLALKEVSKLAGEQDYDYKSLESLTKQALYEEIVYLKKGGFKEKIVLDHLGNKLTEIESITYVLAGHEDLEKLVDTNNLLELYTSFPLPGDTLAVGDLDLATQKKINNFEYGGTTHDFFEPTNHEWENEHAKE